MLDDRRPLHGRFAKDLETYLAKTLQTDVTLQPWSGGTVLPAFLLHRYRFWEAHGLQRPCLFIALLPEAEATPVEIAKQIAMIQPAFDGPVVYAAEGVTASERSRLIAQRVPFAVPDNQLYIPQLAMDLRESFRPPVRGRALRLSPGAQLLLFRHLLQRDVALATPSMLADRLVMTAMTVGRAFDQLAALDLATVVWRGREKMLQFAHPPRELFTRSRTYLQSPVRGRHGVTMFKGLSHDLPLADESGLAALTDLAPPNRPTYAIFATGWMPRIDALAVRTDDLGEAVALIETWRYDPRVLSQDRMVDPLSLIAQFKDHTDERIAQAIEDLEANIAW